MVLYLNTLESPSSKDALYQVWLKLAQWFWWRGLLNFVEYFCYFVIISPWKRVGPFFWTNLNPLHPRVLCAKFGWNWLSVSGEEDFNFNFVNVFSPFHNYLPLEKGGALHLNKLESPSHRDALCQIWLKLAQFTPTRTTTTDNHNGQILIRKEIAQSKSYLAPDAWNNSAHLSGL